MKKRYLRATLLIEVTDLPDRERSELAEMIGIDETELPYLVDYASDDLVEPLQALATDSDELFTGTEVYARYSSVKVESAEWIGDLSDVDR